MGEVNQHPELSTPCARFQPEIEKPQKPTVGEILKRVPKTAEVTARKGTQTARRP